MSKVLHPKKALQKDNESEPQLSAISAKQRNVKIVGYTHPCMMPAPKKSSPAKGTKSAAAVPTSEKPAWVSDGLWQLAQNPSNLIDRLKKADDSEIESECSHAQVASSVVLKSSAR